MNVCEVSIAACLWQCFIIIIITVAAESRLNPGERGGITVASIIVAAVVVIAIISGVFYWRCQHHGLRIPQRKRSVKSHYCTVSVTVLLLKQCMASRTKVYSIMFFFNFFAPVVYS